MIVDAGEDSQILTGQITAGDIAVRNRELKVQADQTILLPDHFTLGQYSRFHSLRRTWQSLNPQTKPRPWLR